MTTYECEKDRSLEKTTGMKVFIKCKLLAKPFVISQFKYAVVLFLFLSTIICDVKGLEIIVSQWKRLHWNINLVQLHMSYDELRWQ